MTDTIYLQFSPADQVGNSVIQQAQGLYEASQRLRYALDDLYASGLHGAFMSQFNARCQNLLDSLRAANDECDEAGRDLLTVVQWAREVDAECAGLFNSRGETFGGGGLGSALLGQFAGSSLSPLVSALPYLLTPSQMLMLYGALQGARFTGAMLDNITEPDVLINALRDLHCDGAAEVLSVLGRSEALAALPSLLGNNDFRRFALSLHNLKDVPHAGLAFNLLDLGLEINERGLSSEVLSEWGFSEGLKTGLDLLDPTHISKIAIAANAGIQFGGGVAIDGSEFWRDALTAGHPHPEQLASYQVMDNSISRFRDALEDSNLDNVFDSAGVALTDYWTVPLVTQFQETLQDPSLANMAQMVDLVSPMPSVSRALWFAEHPQQAQELAVSSAGFLGDVLDVPSGLARLQPAFNDLTASMGTSLNYRFIEVLPIPESIRSYLLGFARFQAEGPQYWRDIRQTPVPDLGDSFRDFAGGLTQ